MVLKLGRVAIFYGFFFFVFVFCFFLFCHFYVFDFDNIEITSFLIKFYGLYFVSNVCPYSKDIVLSLWLQVKEDNIIIYGTDLH